MVDVVEHCVFVRANGDTVHNDPDARDAFVSGEPPEWPATYFNYVDFCLEHDIARIGWPDTGDLRAVPAKERALARGYSFHSLDDYVQRYLSRFRDTVAGSVVLMPDPDAARPGTLYIGRVNRPYHYVPQTPYECAHRLGVAWNRSAGKPVAYQAGDLGIGIQGGWWLWAFHDLSGDRWGPLRAAVARA
jgi:hypothetical protein